MAKTKKKPVASGPEQVNTKRLCFQDGIPCWKVFFNEQRNPLIRSQLITALMTGHQLETERLPSAALLDAVVLAMAARNYCNAEVVDDYVGLLQRANKEWSDPEWTCRRFSQTHRNAASFILMGADEFTAVETQYIPRFVEWLLEQEPPLPFKEEFATVFAYIAWRERLSETEQLKSEGCGS